MKRWWAERSAGEKVGVVIAIIIFGGGLISLFGFVAMSLWNAVMPSVFGLGTISYWQTWGLLILSCIFLGGSRSKGSDNDSDYPERAAAHCDDPDPEPTA